MHHRLLSLSLVAACALSALPAHAAKQEPPEPQLDPTKIINASYSFLKEREPEMTETEYALYEKVIPMISAQPEFALRLLEGMVGEADSSAAFEFVLGNVYFEQKRYADAERRFRLATDKYPTFVRAWDNLGILYFTTERYAEAVPCFTEAIILGRTEPRLFGLLGFCLFKSGNPLAAEAAYLQAYSLDPNNPDWLEGLLSSYLDSEQYSRAESLLRQLVRLKPREGRFWLLLGNVLLTQGRKIDAIAELEAGLALQALEPDGLGLLADLYAEQKFYPEAVRTYQALAARDPDFGTERMLRYASALTGEGSYARALEVLAAVEPLAGEQQKTDVLRARADLHLARKEWTEARALLEQVIARDPLNGRALLDLGTIEETLGNDTQATFYLEAAARLPAQAYAANLKLANLNVKLAHYDDALTYIDEALQLQRSPELLQFQARVQAMHAPAN